jgi:hypothetical protein
MIIFKPVSYFAGFRQMGLYIIKSSWNQLEIPTDAFLICGFHWCHLVWPIRSSEFSTKCIGLNSKKTNQTILVKSWNSLLESWITPTCYYGLKILSKSTNLQRNVYKVPHQVYRYLFHLTCCNCPGNKWKVMCGFNFTWLQLSWVVMAMIVPELPEFVFPA